MTEGKKHVITIALLLAGMFGLIVIARLIFTPSNGVIFSVLVGSLMSVGVCRYLAFWLRQRAPNEAGGGRVARAATAA